MVKRRDIMRILIATISFYLFLKTCAEIALFKNNYILFAHDYEWALIVTDYEENYVRLNIIS